MANAKNNSKQTTVTRVTAKSDKPVAAKKPQKTPTTKVKETSTKQRTLPRPLQSIAKPFQAMGRYFKGAWVELKQVHWPNRRATWSMTGALLLYTAIFVTIILLIDVFFEYLFKLILR